MEYWALVEADFQREYHLQLVECHDMSWRSFITLLGGLSGESVFINVLREKAKKKQEIIEDPELIARNMMMQMSRK